MLNKDYLSRVPWSTQPSLKEMLQEVEIDYDKFISSIKSNKDDLEISEELGISQKNIRHLKNYFIKYGIQSISSQD